MLPRQRRLNTGRTNTAAGNLPAVQHLLARGADLTAANRRGWTALMLAAREGHAAVVTALLATVSAAQLAPTLAATNRKGATASASVRPPQWCMRTFSVAAC